MTRRRTRSGARRARELILVSRARSGASAREANRRGRWAPRPRVQRGLRVRPLRQRPRQLKSSTRAAAGAAPLTSPSGVPPRIIGDGRGYVPRNQIRVGAVQGMPVERSRKTKRADQRVGRRGVAQLLDEPDALLREAQRLPPPRSLRSVAVEQRGEQRTLLDRAQRLQVRRHVQVSSRVLAMLKLIVKQELSQRKPLSGPMPSCKFEVDLSSQTRCVSYPFRSPSSDSGCWIASSQGLPPTTSLERSGCAPDRRPRAGRRTRSPGAPARRAAAPPSPNAKDCRCRWCRRTDGCPLWQEDLQQLPEDVREESAIERAAEEARRPFDLSHQAARFARCCCTSRPTITSSCSRCTHIVTDGWSMGILFSDLAALYDEN